MQRGPLPCSALRWYDVPGKIAGRKCELDWAPKARYAAYSLPVSYNSPEYAAAVLAISFQDTATYEPGFWGARTLLDQLDSMRFDGAQTFTIQGCGESSDPNYAPYLEGALAGCVLDVFYGDYRATYMTRMTPVTEGHWAGLSLEGLSSS